MRNILAPTDRTAFTNALLAARNAGDNAGAKREFLGLIQGRGYTPIAINTVSTIAIGAKSGSIVVTITGDAFKVGITTSDLQFNAHTTAVVLGATTRNTASQITIAWTSTAAVADTLELAVKGSGLTTEKYRSTYNVGITVA